MLLKCCFSIGNSLQFSFYFLYYLNHHTAKKTQSGSNADSSSTSLYFIKMTTQYLHVPNPFPAKILNSGSKGSDTFLQAVLKEDSSL